MSERFQKLRDVATVLNDLSPQADARVYFEYMSGALVWSDEYPPIREEDPNPFPVPNLRGIWAFRTSLIEEQPREKFREAWELAQSLFPNWPGFLSERRDPSLRDLLAREREKTGDPFEELEQRWQAQQAARATNPVKAS